MTSVVALDLDGTLLECSRRQLAVLDEILRAEVGVRADLAQVWASKREGCGTAEALRRSGVPSPVASDVARRWMDVIEDERYLDLDEPLPGVDGALRRLIADGRTVRVLTGRRRTEAAVLQVRRRFAGLVESVRVVSPFAAAQEKAVVLADWGAIAFIGDTESDADAAQRSGTPFVAVACGQRSEEFLRSRGLLVRADLAAAVLAI